jgi:glycosyltransferase involved in cell wall biosynthesis
MSRPTISVLTPTYNRRKFIPAAIQMFKAQTYPAALVEWIVLDDGDDKVGDLFAASGLKNVRYVAVPEKMKIGAKRNRLNELAKGDICVCWDDDDYYPPDRIKNAVTALCRVPGRRTPVAGCSKLYLYYADRQEIWAIGPYNPNHCTNGTMSYWRLQMKDHRYDETVDKAEERSFMKDWTTPVVQMTPEEVMLVICHTKNTFDKRRLLETQNPTMKKTALKIRRFIREKKVADFFAGLKADFAEEATAAAAAATATAPIELDAREINPLLEFAATAAPCADGCGHEHGHAAAEVETAPTLEVTEV